MTDPEKFRVSFYTDRLNELAKEMTALHGKSDTDNVLALIGANLNVIIGSVYDGSLMELCKVMSQFAEGRLLKMGER